jgi:hypothetical protein
VLESTEGVEGTEKTGDEETQRHRETEIPSNSLRASKKTPAGGLEGVRNFVCGAYQEERLCPDDARR